MSVPAFRSVLTPWLAAACLLGSMGIGAAPVEATGVSAALLPATLQVQPDGIFELELTVPVPDDSFNAYDATFTYDPEVLTFLQMSPVSLQEGALMTSACSNRWHVFTPGAASMNISHSLLCAGVRVAGPGVTYKLRFQANLVDAVTTVSFDNILFAYAGEQILPVSTTDAVITVGNPTAVPGDGSNVQARLRAPSPNPFRVAARITFAREADGNVHLAVYAVDGRRVRVLFDEFVPGGAERTVAWDGRDERGIETPAGIYFLRLTTPEGTATRRITRLP